MKAPCLLLLIATASACTNTEQGSEPLLDLNLEVYTQQVQQYVGPGCATLDCHGVGGRPLRLFAADGLRIVGTYREDPLTTQESTANVAAFKAIDPAAPSVEGHIVLLKPLAESAGGMDHVGGELWFDSNAAGYRCLRAWLAGLEPGTSCAEASANLEF